MPWILNQPSSPAARSWTGYFYSLPAALVAARALAQAQPQPPGGVGSVHVVDDQTGKTIEGYWFGTGKPMGLSAETAGLLDDWAIYVRRWAQNWGRPWG